MSRLLADDTPMLMIYLQRIRTRTKSRPVARAVMEAEHRCKYYDELLKHARYGEYRKLALTIEAIDRARERQRAADEALGE